LPSAVASSAANSRIIGKFEGRKPHFKVAHPSVRC
jgi:hypothetical protein